MKEPWNSRSRAGGAGGRPTGPEPSNDNLVFSCLMFARPSSGLEPSMMLRAIACSCGQHGPATLDTACLLKRPGVLAGWAGTES